MIKQAYLYLFILMGIWLTGCQDIDDFPTNPLETDGKTVKVTLSTKVPGITVQSRANATENEKLLKHVDILVFKVEGSGEEITEKFAYRVENPTVISEGDTGNEEVKIKAKLDISTENEEYRLVLLGNLEEEINTLFN